MVSYKKKMPLIVHPLHGNGTNIFALAYSHGEGKGKGHGTVTTLGKKIMDEIR